MLESNYNSHTEKTKNSPAIQTVQSLDCKYCNRTFTSDKHKRMHMTKMHHPDRCVRCCKPFENAQVIPEHMKTHAGDLKPCTCYVCGKGFNGTTDLRNHVNVSTTYDPDQLFF